MINIVDFNLVIMVFKIWLFLVVLMGKIYLGF